MLFIISSLHVIIGSSTVTLQDFFVSEEEESIFIIIFFISFKDVSSRSGAKQPPARRRLVGR